MSYYDANPNGLSISHQSNLNDNRFGPSAERPLPPPSGPGSQDVRLARQFDHHHHYGPGPVASHGFNGPTNMISLEKRLHEQRLADPSPRVPFPPNIPFSSGPLPPQMPLGVPAFGAKPMQNAFHMQYARISVKETVNVPPELSIFASEPKFSQILLRVKEQTNANFIQLLRAASDGAVESVTIDALSRESAELAKNLIETHLKLQMKIKAAENRLQKVQTEFFSTQGEIAAGNVIEFSIRPELLGLAIGKKGARIRQIEADTGVSSINVADTGKITIYGPDAQSVQKAKEQLELYEDSCPLTERQALWLSDKNNSSSLMDLRTSSGVMVAKLNHDALTLDIVGTVSAVRMAKFLWDTQREYLDQEMDLKENERATIEKLQAVRKQYGISRGPRGDGFNSNMPRDKDNKSRKEREKDSKPSSAVSQSLFQNVSASLAPAQRDERVIDPLDALIDPPEKETTRERGNEKEKDRRRDQTQGKQREKEKEKDIKEKEKGRVKDAALPATLPVTNAPIAPPGLAGKKKNEKDSKDKEKEREREKADDHQPMLVKINPILVEQNARKQKEQHGEKQQSKGREKGQKEKEKEPAVVVAPISEVPIPVASPSGPPAIAPPALSLIITPPAVAPTATTTTTNNNGNGRKKEKDNKPKDKGREKDKEKEKAPSPVEPAVAQDKPKEQDNQKNPGRKDKAPKKKENKAQDKEQAKSAEIVQSVPPSTSDKPTDEQTN